MKIIAEVENTLNGTVAVVKNANNSFSVGFLNEKDEFEAKHPNLQNTESVVNALMFYLQAEVYKRNKDSKNI